MIYLIIIASIFLLDFFLKCHIDKTYSRKVQYPRLRGKIILEKYYNNGAALNLLAKKPAVMRAIHTAIILVVGVIYYLALGVTGKPLTKTGLAFLLGGGASNLFDRYARGHVVDYFRINIGSKRLRRIIFNISDFFVFIGALLAVIGTEVES